MYASFVNQNLEQAQVIKKIEINTAFNKTININAQLEKDV